MYIPAAPMLAAVAVILIATIFPASNSTFLTWAMNIAATASYKAVPSILIVAPMGRMNLEILESTLHPCSKLFTVTGRVAELLAVPNAVASAGPI